MLVLAGYWIGLGKWHGKGDRLVRRGDLQLSGMSQPSGTWANQVWNGTPLSRAKAKSWRDAVAMLVIPLAVAEMVWVGLSATFRMHTRDSRTRISVIAVAPPLDCVAL